MNYFPLDKTLTCTINLPSGTEVVFPVSVNSALWLSLPLKDKDEHLEYQVKCYIDNTTVDYPDYFELYTATYVCDGEEVAYYDNQQ